MPDQERGVERPEERRVLTVAEVFALVAAVPPRFRALVLLATCGSMRWGELAALRRNNLDLEARAVKIDASVSEMKIGEGPGPEDRRCPRRDRQGRSQAQG
ncbi:hypothetical protein GCM10010412_022920 [Nonomuraea recticatena]|uniref:Tyr recombinase domain-containing protein n=1 Tax=Nonomuraea recticatena TaxID=46178 RepID=A0ABP6DW63_9ACTN